MRLFVLAVSALFAVGCTASSPYMRMQTTPLALQPPPQRALVVFVRPSAMAFAIGANILDEGGRFLGDALAKSYFAVAVTPGHHEFTVWAENTDALAADVVAGRVYFVEVSPSMGAFSARMHLKAIKPGLPSWTQREEWLRAAKPFTPDVAAGQANLDGRSSDVAERLRRAKEHLSTYRGSELAEHQLGPDDGLGG